jgi:hypothetical protein
MKTPTATKGVLAGTNKGKTAIYRGEKFDLFLNGQFYLNKNIKMEYSSVQRGKRRQNEPYKV